MFVVSAKAAVFLEVKGRIVIDSAIQNAQAKVKKATDMAVKLRKIIDAPDYADKSCRAVQEVERKRLADLVAEQRNYQRSIEQFQLLKLLGEK